MSPDAAPTPSTAPRPALRPSLRPAGDKAVLVDLPDAATRRRFDDALLADPPAGLVDQVPALSTVLVTFATPRHLAEALPHLRTLDLAPAVRPIAVGDVVTIEVAYDGPDLADVATLLGVPVAEVVARHTGQLWRVDFAGFMPGFGYLTGEAGGLAVPRLATPRTAVPAGSVGLAGDFTGVYPRSSPGGWRLIGRTDAVLWDADRTPPALLAPGRRIRFVEAPR